MTDIDLFRSDRRRPWRRLALWCLLLAVIAHLVVSVAVHAQIERDQQLSEKVAAMETRTAVLENEMNEVVWLGRGIVLALIGQVVVLLMRPDRRRGPRMWNASEIAEYLRRSPDDEP